MSGQGFHTAKDTSETATVIVDYGLGNLRSIAGAVERVGYPVDVSSDPKQIESATKLILPGVGAFGDGMKNLRSRGLIDPLNNAVLNKRTPILGICLGFQLFARDSAEFGSHAGLGWIEASVVRIEPSDRSLRVPHVGWDNVFQVRPSPLFRDISSEALFYFVHSYYMDCAASDSVIGRCEYGVAMPVAYERQNIFGTQFHPEKSQLAGLMLLRNFLDL